MSPRWKGRLEMVSVDVILGAAGGAGFTFGLVRTRLADSRSPRDEVRATNPGTAEHPNEKASDAGL